MYIVDEYWDAERPAFGDAQDAPRTDQPVQSPFVQNALDGTLPAKDLTEETTR